MDKVLQYITDGTALKIAVTIIVVAAIWIIADRVLSHLSKRVAPENGDNNLFHFMKIIKRWVRWVLVIIGVLIVLNTCGIKVTSYLAGLGIASVIVGLALQDALKDVINGVNIMVDNFYRIGDYIDYEGRTCLVEDVRIKVTKLEDVVTHDHLVVSNRLVMQSIKISGYRNIVIATPYEESYETISAVVDEILEEIRSTQPVEEAFSKEISNFADSAIEYTICIKVDPKIGAGVENACRVIIKKKLDEKGISVPFPQLDVHTN